jgi:hypothetical protein
MPHCFNSPELTIDPEAKSTNLPLDLKASRQYAVSSAERPGRLGAKCMFKLFADCYGHGYSCDEQFFGAVLAKEEGSPNDAAGTHECLLIMIP